MNEIELSNALKYAELQLMLSTNESKTRFFRTIVQALRAEQTRQENAQMTWNERINQMTVEEKADVAVILSKRCARALKKESCPDLTCWQCFIEFFNSPYTEGEKV